MPPPPLPTAAVSGGWACSPRAAFWVLGRSLPDELGAAPVTAIGLAVQRQNASREVLAASGGVTRGPPPDLRRSTHFSRDECRIIIRGGGGGGERRRSLAAGDCSVQALTRGRVGGGGSGSRVRGPHPGISSDRASLETVAPWMGKRRQLGRAAALAAEAAAARTRRKTRRRDSNAGRYVSSASTYGTHPTWLLASRSTLCKKASPSSNRPAAAVEWVEFVGGVGWFQLGRALLKAGADPTLSVPISSAESSTNNSSSAAAAAQTAGGGRELLFGPIQSHTAFCGGAGSHRLTGLWTILRHVQARARAKRSSIAMEAAQPTSQGGGSADAFALQDASEDRRQLCIEEWRAAGATAAKAAQQQQQQQRRRRRKRTRNGSGGGGGGGGGSSKDARPLRI